MWKPSWRGVLAGSVVLGIAVPILAPPETNAAVVLCQRKARVKLRLDACRRRETQIDATELGVVGPPGPRGLAGPQGDPGMPGATDVVVRTQSFGAAPSGVHTVFIVMCESEERAVGGGAGFAGNAGNEELQQSYPVEADQTAAEAGDTPAGWVSIIKNNTGAPLVATGYVVCARP